MGETDPFVCLRRQCPTRPGPSRRTLGECTGRTGKGGRVVVAHSYSTPDVPWHTIWRALANRGE
ncbi:hypothetical protein GCM10009535_24360 [Streptomyces thermocarboxydovorans]|uniref:Uncharacterized protein n=1 Tax=Streptomyces thermocarboxydovorans TaxID=59298 RepID=A0ABN1HG69_9ACTN